MTIGNKTSARVFSTPVNLDFQLYTRREIERISFKKITAAKSLDEFGVAVPNGLNDIALGSCNDFQVCETCNNFGDNCPGHIGHFELPLTAFNPAFFHIAMNIIRGTCVFCHRMGGGSSGFNAKLFIAQLRLLQMGKVSGVDQLQYMCEKDGSSKQNEISDGNFSYDAQQCSIMQIEQAFEQLTGVAWRDFDIRKHAEAPTRHVFSVRDKLVKDFQRNFLYRRVLKCKFCARKSPTIKHYNQTELVLGWAGKPKPIPNTTPKTNFDSTQTSFPDLASINHTPKQNSSERKRKSVKFETPQDFETTIQYQDEYEMFINQLSSATSSALQPSGVQRAFDFFDNIDVKEEPQPILNEIKTDVEINDAMTEKLNIKITEAIDKQLKQVTSGHANQIVWRATECRDHLRTVYRYDGYLLEQVFPILANIRYEMLNSRLSHKDLAYDPAECPLDALFLDVIAVSSPKFRPIRRMSNMTFDHPRTICLKRIMQEAELVQSIITLLDDEAHQRPIRHDLKDFVETQILGSGNLSSKLHIACRNMQRRVNAIFDSALDKIEVETVDGLRQVLEKKEGLFRKNMMGKRVNYACRSVITPDPYLAVDEVGVPVVFAQQLTFTEPVNDYNIELMKKLVKNGPKHYPGANNIVNEMGVMKIIPAQNENMRQSQSESLHVHHAPKIISTQQQQVKRHLRNNDVLLMNRQPTLHKPSIMGHRTRVLFKQRALRMNYAPCKAYNADFDGDEMNGHFVQDYIARAETGELVSAVHNFTVPKDGTPILGLIQDHVVSGVLLSMRDKFFTREDYNHLVLSAFPQMCRKLKVLPPTILKPRVLWTGKQVISSVILNVLPADSKPLNLIGKTKTGHKNWQLPNHPVPDEAFSEAQVIIRNGQLLVGVLDKAHFGATQFGLVHCCHELYSAKTGCDLLSAFSRLFTTYLQLHAFTLGVADILVEKAADLKRNEALNQLRACGDTVARRTFNLDDNADQLTIKRALANAYHARSGNVGDIKQLDYNMKRASEKYNDMVNSVIMPHGLIQLFPYNNLQLMIQSGAKGSSVNAMQISCMLGQIELEGARPPLTAAGRTLPSFKEFDTSPRANGFVDQRFLTGLKPQELFFHTMAGREGLIDTAVKTSRSGYLQRCIIKHLEGLSVQYDSTVRDTDKGVVQFRYGEDGMDIGAIQFLQPKNYAFYQRNAHIVKKQMCSAMNETQRKAFEKSFRRDLNAMRRQATEFRLRQRNQSDFIHFWNANVDLSQFNGLTGADLKNRMIEAFRIYNPPEARVEQRKMHVRFDPINEKKREALPEKFLNELAKVNDRELRKLLSIKGHLCLAPPGDNVGLLAAQSIGEPSTQMTLNTFHFAGRGEMNVTLGIPRLREILMAGTKDIATPMATVPILSHVTREQADMVAAKLDRIPLSDVLSKVAIEERLHMADDRRVRRYRITLKLSKMSRRETTAAKLLRRDMCLRGVENTFCRYLGVMIDKKCAEAMKRRLIYHERITARTRNDVLEAPPPRRHNDEEDSSGAEDNDDADAATAQLMNRHNDEAAEYEGEDQDKEDAGCSNSGDELESIDDEDLNIKKEQDDDEESNATKKMDADRVAMVVQSTPRCTAYEYDAKASRWCALTLEIDVQTFKLDIHSMVKTALTRCAVQSTPNITKSIIVENNGERQLQTQGINFAALHLYNDKLDLNRFYCNQPNTIATTFGIEAAAKALQKEVSSVFAVYGIEVDARHLSLLSDYMTQCGDIHAFNRTYMGVAPSPIQQMSFETTVAFMRQNMMAAYSDPIVNPSAAIVVGRPFTSGGTNCFDIKIDAASLVKSKKQMPIFEANNNLQSPQRKNKRKTYCQKENVPGYQKTILSSKIKR